VNAADIMTREVVTVPPNAPLRVCMALMEQHRISGVPVVEGGKLVGIVTEGDIIKKLRKELPWYAYIGSPVAEIPTDLLVEEPLPELLERVNEMPVERIMTRRVVTVPPQTGIREVARILLERRIKRVPVVEGGQLLGIVARSDLVRGMLKAQPT
jgi:CBS domain-containing protein